MGLPFENFACDRCGACCSLIVEAEYLDAVREPKLLSVESVDLEKLRNGGCVILWDTQTHRCPFLQADKACGIYATRPNVCVSLEAGDYKCQVARSMKGLALLADRDGNLPTRKMMSVSADEYGCEPEEDFLPMFPVVRGSK